MNAVKDVLEMYSAGINPVLGAEEAATSEWDTEGRNILDKSNSM